MIHGGRQVSRNYEFYLIWFEYVITVKELGGIAMAPPCVHDPNIKPKPGPMKPSFGVIPVILSDQVDFFTYSYMHVCTWLYIMSFVDRDKKVQAVVFSCKRSYQVWAEDCLEEKASRMSTLTVS